MQINSAKDLNVYKAAYELAMKVFAFSKGFPAEERFALTSQIRRSSRSICLNLREAWEKRKIHPRRARLCARADEARHRGSRRQGQGGRDAPGGGSNFFLVLPTLFGQPYWEPFTDREVPSIKISSPLANSSLGQLISRIVHESRGNR